MTIHKHSREFLEFQGQTDRILSILRLFTGLATAINPLIPLLENLPDNLKRGTIDSLLTDLEHFNRAFPTDDQSHNILEQTLTELLICRCADAFLIYLSHLLMSLFSQQPDKFLDYFKEPAESRGGADKKISVNDVLEKLIDATDKSEVILWLAERQVTELAYYGFEKIMKDLNARLKLGFKHSTPEYESVCELLLVRNLVTHNASRVSLLFLQKTRRGGLKVGDLYP